MDNIFELESLKAIDPQMVDRTTLIDIRDVSVKEELSKEERIIDFIKQIKNPYLCKCGNMVVQSVFTDNDVTLTERLQQYFKTV